MFIKEKKLLRPKFVWGSPGVKLLTSCVGSILVVLASHFPGKKQFVDDVIGGRLPIEFVA